MERILTMQKYKERNVKWTQSNKVEINQHRELLKNGWLINFDEMISAFICVNIINDGF